MLDSYHNSQTLFSVEELDQEATLFLEIIDYMTEICEPYMDSDDENAESDPEANQDAERQTPRVHRVGQLTNPRERVRVGVTVAWVIPRN